MRLADRTLSIADFRRLGALEIYTAAEVVAFARGRAATGAPPADGGVDDGLSFRIGQLFASPTKVHRLLWLARRPGVLPSILLRRFAQLVASRCVERLSAADELADIRLKAALVAHQQHLDGGCHLRSLDSLRADVEQAQAAHRYLELFRDAESEAWLRHCLSDLIERSG